MRYLLLLFIVVAASCGPATHLKLSERHRLIAISKGAQVSNDTVFVTKTVYVPIEGKEDSSSVSPDIDTTSFDLSINRNDSLVAERKAIEAQIASDLALDKEKAMERLYRVNSELLALRKRMAQGFSKDSVYVHEPDSLTTITAEVKDGILKKITYSRKPALIKKEMTVPVWVEQAISAGFQKWHIIALLGGALVVGLVLGLFLRTGREK